MPGRRRDPLGSRSGGGLRNELQRYGIGAVPRVLCREPLAQEDVAQVGAAVGALDLRPASVGVGDPLDRARYLVVEGRPAAPRVELVLGTIEGRLAPPAEVRPRPEIVLVLAGEGPLRPLVDYDLFLLRG